MRTNLPRRGYVIREKHLRRFRTLARQLGSARLRRDLQFDGLLHMGADNNEIWIEATLSRPEKEFTIIHELVHARRQLAGEDGPDDVFEESVVEMEAIARARRPTLAKMPAGLILVVLHDYLTRGGRDNPATRSGLAAVYRRIRTLLRHRSPKRSSMHAVTPRRGRPREAPTVLRGSSTRTP